MHSLTFRHGYLYVNAMGVVEDGNKDLGAFDIVSKSLKKIQRKLREYFKAKESGKVNCDKNGVLLQGTYYTSESDACIDSGSERDVIAGNTYGAAGSSAGMSDSELLRMRAPAFSRKAGRPKELRYRGVTDYYTKKTKRKRGAIMNSNSSVQTAKKRKETRCSECKLLGHTGKQCTKKPVDLSTELPEF